MAKIILHGEDGIVEVIECPESLIEQIELNANMKRVSTRDVIVEAMEWFFQEHGFPSAPTHTGVQDVPSANRTD